MKAKFKEKEIPEISRKIIEKILKSKSKNATVLAFSGDLGAGKTTITKEIAKQFGVKKNIISPTFVIMKIYEVGKGSLYFSKFKKLIHIDAYRFDQEDEILKIGWKDMEGDKENFIILEWPENVKKHIDKDSHWIKLEHIDEDTRMIEF